MKKKNILVIVIDCLRQDHIEKVGNSYIPTIKKWKEEGFSFSNTIASTSTTTPSFASLLTGLYPSENGVRSHSAYSLNEDVKTFTELFKEKGYNTYAEVTGPLFKEVGLHKGFDEYNHRSVKEHIHKKWGDDLIEKFKSQYKGPWFVLLHIWPLHLPRKVIRERKDKKFGDTTYARALSSIDFFLSRLDKVLDDDTIIVFTGDHGEQISYSKTDFFKKKIKEMNFRLKKKLKLTKTHFAKGMKDCLVGHGYNVYDILVNVPFIIHQKDIVQKGSSDCQVRQIDILPTISDMANIESDISCTGKSALPIIKKEDSKNRDAFIEAVGIIIPNKDEWLSGIRVDNKYKYIYSPFKEDYEEELYDLEKDPYENENIAKENQEIISELKKKIENMHTEDMKGKKIDSDDEAMMKKKLKELGYF